MLIEKKNNGKEMGILLIILFFFCFVMKNSFIRLGKWFGVKVGSGL